MAQGGVRTIGHLTPHEEKLLRTEDVQPQIPKNSAFSTISLFLLEVDLMASAHYKWSQKAKLYEVNFMPEQPTITVMVSNPRPHLP